jgi:hypothetical protein
MPLSHTHDPELEGAEARPQGPAPQDGGGGGIEAPAETVSELIEEAWRAAGRLALRETQLAAVRHGPQLRRAASDLAIALNVVLAFLTAFALANWAAASALSGPLPGWAAALVLATTWIVIGILLVLVLNRGERVLDWRRIWRLGADVKRRTGAREWARHEAQQRMRESLEQLAGEVGERAGAALVSSAVVPVAGGVISAGEHVIDQIDELTDDLGKAIPGGGVINRVADIALLPGRYLAGVARTAVEGLSDEVKLPDQPSSTQSRPRKVSGLNGRRGG